MSPDMLLGRGALARMQVCVMCHMKPKHLDNAVVEMLTFLDFTQMDAGAPGEGGGSERR